MKSFKKIYRDVIYVSRITKTNNKKLIIFSAVLLAQLTALADILLILFFSAIITNTFDQNNFFTPFVEAGIQYKFLLPVVVFVRFLCIYLQSMTLKKLELNVQENLKLFLLTEVFEKRNYSVADAYFYINVLAGHVSFFYSNLASFLNSSLQILAYVAYLVIADTRTIATFFIGALIIFFPTKFLISRAREFMDKTYIFSQQTNFEIQRIIENMFLIKILKKDKEEISNFFNTIKNANFNELSNHKYGAINSFLPSFVTMFIFSILLTFTSLAKAITLDFIGVTLRLFQSIGTFNGSMNKIINSHVHIEKFYEIDKNKLLIDKNNFQYAAKESKNIIEIENLSFEYFNSDEPIFEELNLSIPKNTHTILTGPNGSGKSTLLGLISGVLYSQKGTVKCYKKNFGYIGATPLIFTGTIKENILYGNEEHVSDDEIMSYLKKMELFKESKRYNLDAIIDNKSLSSGQMQKVSFIRALVGNVDIMLLDESTANLDEKSRKLIFDILRNQEISIINSTHDPDSFGDVDHRLRIEIIDEKRKLIFE
jgi:ATP-binding cassette, subfamily B, bacterial AbcA/BmrA